MSAFGLRSSCYVLRTLELALPRTTNHTQARVIISASDDINNASKNVLVVTQILERGRSGAEAFLSGREATNQSIAGADVRRVFHSYPIFISPF